MQRIQEWSTYIGALGIALVVAAGLLFVITGIRRDVLLLLAGLGVVLVGFYIVTRPRDPERQSSNLRTASNSVNVLLVALAVIGIVGAVNYIINRQFAQRIDLTANHEHTLSQQTVQVLQSLKEPVNVIGFFTAQTQSQRNDTEALLKDYQAKTDKLNVQFVDPDQNPTLAQKYELTQAGTIIFEKGTRTEKVYNADESGFTNAILKVTQTQQPVIYFTSGHGEYGPDDSQQNGMSVIASYMKQVNYKVAPLNLATISNTLPADTRTVVIAGPTKKFSADDEKVLKNYMDKGGRMLILTDVGVDFGLGDLLKAWGLTLQNDLVLDPNSNFHGNPPIPVFTQFPSSPVTQDLSSLTVYFPGTRSLKKEDQTDKSLTALFTTSDAACAKTDLTKIQQDTQLQCESGDAKGPFVIGYTAEGAAAAGAGADQTARLIVIGNAAFATNNWMNRQDSLGNQQLVINMLNWLAGQEQLIAIPPRDPNLHPLTALSGNDLNLVAWTSIGLIPLASLIIGGILWWRRR